MMENILPCQLLAIFHREAVHQIAQKIMINNPACLI